MIEVKMADEEYVEGIVSVCTDAYWATYGGSYPADYIQRIVDEFYNTDRVFNEVTVSNKQWGGYFVAVENNDVVGAGGGGMTGETTGEIFVLYLNPERRNEGIGSLLLKAITAQQKDFGAAEQWVSVKKGNQKGIPFYEAKGLTFEYEKPGYWDSHYNSLRYHRFLPV